MSYRVKSIDPSSSDAGASEAADFLAARKRLIQRMITFVPFGGWNKEVLLRAAADLGVSEHEADLLFPDARAVDFIAFYSSIADDQMRKKFARLKKVSGVRGQIMAALSLRLDDIFTNFEAYKRAAPFLSANPQASFKMFFATADSVWRAIGDSSSDINFYSKRVLLAQALALTALYVVGREVPDKDKALAFLSRRINGAMQFGRRLGGISLPSPKQVKLPQPLIRVRRIMQHLERRSPIHQFTNFRRNLRKRR